MDTMETITVKDSLELDRRVAHLESSLAAQGEVLAHIKTVVDRLSVPKPTPYGNWIAGGTLILGMTIAVFAPIRSDINRVELDTLKLESEVITILRNRHTSEEQSEYASGMNEWQRLQDSKIADLEKELAFERGRLGQNRAGYGDNDTL